MIPLRLFDANKGKIFDVSLIFPPKVIGIQLYLMPIKVKFFVHRILVCVVVTLFLIRMVLDYISREARARVKRLKRDLVHGGES